MLKNYLTECQTGSDRFTLIMGEQGGGKSHLLLETMKYHLKNNTFTQYYCVFPALNNEKNGSYDFLKNDKTLKDKVFFTNEYNRGLSKELFMKQNVEDAVDKIMYIIDDGTGEEQLFKDPFLCKISCKCRHLKISLFIAIHSDGASIIPPKVRIQAQFIFLGNIHPIILEKCYKSYVNFSKDFPRFRNFQEYMEEFVYTNEHGLLFIDRINRQYNPDVSLWKIAEYK